MKHHNRIDDKTKKKFPLLHDGNYQKTSPQTSEYNCVAFALDDEKHWWQPPCAGRAYHTAWHPKAPDINHWIAYVRLFEIFGYKSCDEEEFEFGFEKVAIYWGLDGIHVAKQNPDGTWKSKLGDLEDIIHDNLEALESDGELRAYGKVQRILKRSFQHFVSPEMKNVKYGFDLESNDVKWRN